jgi:hypothetical protein
MLQLHAWKQVAVPLQGREEISLELKPSLMDSRTLARKNRKFCCGKTQNTAVCWDTKRHFWENPKLDYSTVNRFLLKIFFILQFKILSTGMIAFVLMFVHE